MCWVLQGCFSSTMMGRWQRGILGRRLAGYDEYRYQRLLTDVDRLEGDV